MNIHCSTVLAQNCEPFKKKVGGMQRYVEALTMDLVCADVCSVPLTHLDCFTRACLCARIAASPQPYRELFLYIEPQVAKPLLCLIMNFCAHLCWETSMGSFTPFSTVFYLSCSKEVIPPKRQVGKLVNFSQII